MVSVEDNLWKHVLLKLPDLEIKIRLEHQVILKIYFCGLIKSASGEFRITSQESQDAFNKIYDKRQLQNEPDGHLYFLVLKEMFYSVLVLLLTTQANYRTGWYPDVQTFISHYPSFENVESDEEIENLMMARNFMINALDILVTWKANKKLAIAIATRLQSSMNLSETGQYATPASRRKCYHIYEQESGIQPILRPTRCHPKPKKRTLSDLEQSNNNDDQSANSSMLESESSENNQAGFNSTLIMSNNNDSTHSYSNHPGVMDSYASLLQTTAKHDFSTRLTLDELQSIINRRERDFLSDA